MTEYLEKYKELNEIVTKLLSPDGCPWDREQTHETLKNYLIEEAYEFVEAVEENDNSKMEEELGDILFHVVIHAAIAEKTNKFSLKSVTEKISEKMIRRHPHVFGDTQVSSVEEVWTNWDKIKRTETKKKDKESLLRSVPKNLPALLRAEKIQKRAARVGFDWDHINPVLDKIEEEMNELKEVVALNDKPKMIEEMGDYLFSIVNLCRKMDIDPEDALQMANKKFIQRFSSVEGKLIKNNKEMIHATMEEMDELWEKVKEEDQ
ncbi:MAG: nucleoside triphosphate pyrophosphohydrolase [Candidatus Margulisbacteria bacterium GWF2_35_9]|nr:MAG: nucleoside triphosphate pyrophosphohydrolase [Candidatus Margulisbacteria bacterium GWF2_35_9]